MLAETLGNEVKQLLLEAESHKLRLLYCAFEVVHILKGVQLAIRHLAVFLNCPEKLFCLLFLPLTLLLAFACLLREVKLEPT